VASFRPLASPFYSLAATLIPHLEPAMSEVDRLKESRKLAEGLNRGTIDLDATLGRILQKNSETEHLLLVIDQFEEIFTLCPIESDRERFIKALLSCIDKSGMRSTSNLTILLTLRGDFFDQALHYSKLSHALQISSLILGRMTSRELRDAIEKPAFELGMKIEEGLSQRIIKDLSSSPGQLPLLEFALTLLWSNQHDGCLTHAAYEEIGGVDNALAGYAETIYGQLSETGQQQARRVFIQLVRPGQGTKDVRRLATEKEVGNENWALVAQLADARLVVTGRNDSSGNRTVEIVHEALIEGWARLRDWMEADREFRTWQEQLRSAIDLWKKRKRDESALLRGTLLSEARDWLKRKEEEKQPNAISASEREYIKSSIALRDRERAAQDRRRRRFTSAAVLTAIGFLVLAGMLYVLRARSERDRELAQLRQLAYQAEAMRTQNPELLERSILLTLEVLKRSPSLEAEQSLRRGLKLLPRLITKVTSDGAMTGVTFSPSGQYFATASKDGNVKLWEINTGKEVWHVPHKGMLEKVAFSPDGRFVAASSEPKIVSIWQALSGQEIYKLPHGKTVTDIAFSPNGTQLATASDDQTLRIWDLSNGKELRRITQDAGLRRVVYSRDGKYLATIQLMGRSALIFDPFTGKQIAQMDHDGMILNLAFSPDGMYLATGSTDNSARLWDVKSGKEIARLMHGFTVNAMDFSPDGKYLATASEDRTARVWEISSKHEVARVVHEDDVHFIRFSPDGDRVVSGCINKFDKKSRYFAARVWEPIGGREIARLPHEDGLHEVDFSPDGTYIATASGDKTARIWDALDPQAEKTKDQPLSGRAFANLLSSNRRYHALVRDDGFAQVWELGDNAEVRRLVSESRIRLSTAASHASMTDLSPNGRYLAELRMGRYEEPSVEDDFLLIWDLSDGHEVASIKTTGKDNAGRATSVLTFEFDPTGEFITLLCEPVGIPSANSTDEPSFIRILRTADYQEVRKFFLSSRGAEFVYSPKGEYLVTTDFKNSARIWDSQGGREIFHAQHEITDKENGFQNLLDCADVSSDGQLLATGSWDHTARVWDINNGKEVVRLPHESHLRGVSFSPDGKHLATGTEDSIVRVWNISNGEEVTRFSGQDDSLPSLQFSPNGRFLIELTDGSAISTWIWARAELMNEACARLTRNLTLEEWSQYFGDEPYQKTCSNLSEASAPPTDLSNVESQDSLIDNEPDEPMAYYQRGWERIDQKDYDGAIADLTEVIKETPKDADAYSARAIAYGHKKMVDQALADFSRAEALGGDRARIYTNRGSLFSNLGDSDKALEEYQAATRADPKFSGSFFNRSQLYIKQKKYNEAISDLTIVIELEPNNTEAFHRRGLSYQSVRNNRQAIADFRTMLLRASNEHTRQDARRHLVELGEPIETMQPSISP
jgi:WD40 repeat protein/Tfp pilus assembly protein PilF